MIVLTSVSLAIITEAVYIAVCHGGIYANSEAWANRPYHF